MALFQYALGVLVPGADGLLRFILSLLIDSALICPYRHDLSPHSEKACEAYKDDHLYEKCNAKAGNKLCKCIKKSCIHTFNAVHIGRKGDLSLIFRVKEKFL